MIEIYFAFAIKFRFDSQSQSLNRNRNPNATHLAAIDVGGFDVILQDPFDRLQTSLNLIQLLAREPDRHSAAMHLTSEIAISVNRIAKRGQNESDQNKSVKPNPSDQSIRAYQLRVQFQLLLQSLQLVPGCQLCISVEHFGRLQLLELALEGPIVEI